MKNIITIILTTCVLFSASHVQVIHNSASPTVDVYIDGNLAIEDFMYRTATPVLELGTSFTVGIAPADGDVIASFPFELEDGGEYVVVATGLLGNDDTPFNLAATATTFGADAGNVGLEVYHGSTDAPAVDVLANGAVLLSNLAYGDFSGYAQVPAADYVIGIAPTGGESIADFSAPLSGLGGGSAVVFASGFLSGDDPAFGLFAALNDGTVLTLETYTMNVDLEYNAQKFELNGLYPNPFNPITNLSFNVSQQSNISLEIYDLLGNKITLISNKSYSIGNHTVEINLNKYPSGYYILKLSTENTTQFTKLTLLK